MTSIAARIMDNNYCHCTTCKSFKDKLVQHIFKEHSSEFQEEIRGFAKNA